MPHRGAKDEVQLAVEQWPEEYRAWAREFHAGLVFGGLQSGLIAQELGEQLQSVRSSGRPPLSLLGPGAVFGRERATELLPATERLDRGLPVRGFVHLAKIVMCLLVLLFVGFGIYLGFRDGWMFHSWQIQQVAAFVAGAVGGAAALWGWIALTRGYLSAAVLWWISVPLVVLGATALAEAFAGQRPLPLPNVWVPLIGVAALVLLALLPGSAAPQAALTAVLENRAWFRRVEQLLRGRYFFSRTQARSSVEELRAHVAELPHHHEPGSAQQEFGPAPVLAASLAAASRESVIRYQFLRNAAAAVVLFCYGWVNISYVVQGGFSVMRLVVGISWFFLLALLVRALLPSQRRRGIEQVLKQRRLDAAALAAGQQ